MKAARFYAQSMGGGDFAYVIDREAPKGGTNIVQRFDDPASARAMAELLNAALALTAEDLARIARTA